MKVPEPLSAIHNYLKKSPESAQWFRANSNARSTFACYLLCQEQRAHDGSAKTNDQSYRQHIRDRKDCGNYAALTVLPGDAGHLSYGRSQAALGSGTLFSLLDAYCERSDAKFAASLRPWLPRVQNKDCALDRDEAFRSILEKASTDPAMQAAQDQLFDHAYFIPACTSDGCNGHCHSAGRRRCLRQLHPGRMEETESSTALPRERRTRSPLPAALYRAPANLASIAP
jgi:hypothetical protein